jgi:hypothetical protein
MRRAVCGALLVILAAFQSQGTQPERNAGVSLDQLMEAFRTVRHVEARYVERRTLHALRTPIETRGTLRFDAPGHLEKTSDPTAADAPPGGARSDGARSDGAGDRMTIDGNRLTIDHAGGSAPIVVMLNEHPEIGVLIESIRATLSGDGEALRRIFDISLAGTINGWQIVLQPHDPERREILQWMRISGDAGRITEIDTQQGDGDHSEMMIGEPGR